MVRYCIVVVAVGARETFPFEGIVLGGSDDAFFVGEVRCLGVDAKTEKDRWCVYILLMRC